ncbi:MAG TPA: sensor histidine kinase [Desulfonatronum sp.]|nr:sensor histidine kinase [Desulfonatronum sp.]
MSATTDYQALHWRLFTSFLSFSLVPLFVLGFFLYTQFSVSYKEKVLDGMRTLVENRKSAIELFFEERVSQLSTLAHSLEYENLIHEQYLLQVFNVMQTRSKSYIDIGIIDQNGNHVAYVGPHPELRGVNYKNEEWFMPAMSSGLYISDVFRGFRWIPHVIIAVTVRQQDKSFMLRATINLDIIENIVRSAQVGRYGDAYLINRNNILQTNPRFSGAILEQPAGPDFSRTSTTRLEEISLKEKRAFFAATYIPTTHWVLVIIEDPQEQLSPLLRARDWGGILFVLAVVMITLGTYMITRAIMTKLKRIAREKAVSDDMVFQSNKMAALGKMAAGIAHEINNPLAVIGEKAGWVKDLLHKENIQDNPNLKECDDAVTKIEYHVDRARKVTHRLLGFARRMEPIREVIDINKLLKDTMVFLENEAHFRDIGLVTDFDAQLPTITSDASQLQQVFLNIINNAVDAVDHDGEVTISTRFDDHANEIQVLVHDTGPGIRQENLDKIFDPFFTTKDPGKGTGLGLSISYQIVESLGGKICVTSEIGKGSTFTISLPV